MDKLRRLQAYGKLGWCNRHVSEIQAWEDLSHLRQYETFFSTALDQFGLAGLLHCLL